MINVQKGIIYKIYLQRKHKTNQNVGEFEFRLLGDNGALLDIKLRFSVLGSSATGFTDDATIAAASI